MIEAAPRPATATGERRVDWLDALRGWAITGVVLVHASIDVPNLGQPWHSIAFIGQYGVQLFFVISALTVFHTYERELARGRGWARASLAWLVKRAFRIAPLYYFGIALYLALFAAMRARGSLIPFASTADVLANMTFVHTWVPSAQNKVVPGGWSIGVEMMFYLAVPFLDSRLRSPRACLVWFLLSATAAELVDRLLAASAGDGGVVTNDSFLYFWLVTQLPVFLAGLWLLRRESSHIWAGAAVEPGVAAAYAAFGVAMAAFGLWLGVVGQFDHVLAPAAMGMAFCGLVMGCRAPLLRPVLVNAVSVRIGRLSYSIYIVHFAFVLALRLIAKLTGLHDSLPGPALWLGSFVLSLAGATVVAAITYRLVEQPGIELGRRLAASIARRGVFARMRYSEE